MRLHDIHHIVTEYKSDPCGEAEISAWELAAGIYNKYFAGLVGLAALFYGAFYTLQEPLKHLSVVNIAVHSIIKIFLSHY